MNKKYIFSLFLISSIPAILAGCNQEDNKTRLTFGSYINNSAIDISYDEFATRMNKNENMLVVTYHGENSPGCSCWTTFKAIIDKFAEENDYVIYQIDRQQFLDKTNTYGLTMLTDSNPTIFVTKEGSVKAEYLNGKNNKPMFESYSGFQKALAKIVKKPQTYIVNRDYLYNRLFDEKKESIVYYARENCGDCNYCTPNFLTPYSQKNNLNKPILYMDIQYLYDNKPEYQSFKDEYKLSKAGDEIFGYDTGVVPTFQYWKDGKLLDMNVYFNDMVEKVEDKWTVTSTYYTKERVNNLKYTNTVLKDMVVPDEEMEAIEYNGTTYNIWKQDAAAVHHNKILKSFLDKYAK